MIQLLNGGVSYGGAALLIGEYIARIILLQTKLFPTGAGNPNVLVVILDRYGVAGGAGALPRTVNFPKKVSTVVVPIEGWDLVLREQDFVVRGKTEVILGSAEKTVRARDAGLFQNAGLSFFAFGGSGEYERRRSRER